MVKGQARVYSKMGLHARPAAVIASYVGKCEADVVFRYKDRELDPSRYLALMSLGAKAGDVIELEVNGSDEAQVYSELKRMIETLD